MVNSIESCCKTIIHKNRKELMRTEQLQLRPVGKGFIIAKINDGLPPMRRLVKAYMSIDKKPYIKLNGEIAPLLPSHKYISGN